MYLENLVFDALEPQRLGHFWEAVVSAENLTDEPGILETRLTIAGGPALDLCFQPVTERPTEPPRLQVALTGGSDVAVEVERLLALGALRTDPGQGTGGLEQVHGTLLADPEGNLLRVTPDDTAYVDSGPVAALALDSADPHRDAAFWAWLTGWTEITIDTAAAAASAAAVTAAGTSETPRRAARSLRHPSLRGPVLELRPEATPKGVTKNRRHLDLRLEPGDDPDAVAAGIAERGGAVLHTDWGDLPWRSYTDPSGNELCVLPATS